MTELLSEQPVRCPYCDEPITLLVDISAGPASWIEDCEVCCQPILVTASVDGAELTSLGVDRAS